MGRRRWTFAGLLTLVLALPGQAVAAPTADPSAVDFGQVRVGGPPSTRTVTFSPALLSDGEPTVSGTDFSIGTKTCPPPALASSCTVDVVFSPSARAARTGTLTYGGTPVALSGTGVAPVATLEAPTSFAFGTTTVGQKSAGQSTNVRNTGDAPLTITGIALGGASPGDFALGYCAPLPITLQPGQACYVGALFQPGSAGDKSASIAITHDAGAAPLTIPLGGTGAGAPNTPNAPANPAPPATVDGGPGGGSTAAGAPLVSISSPKRNATVRRTFKRRRNGKLVSSNRAVTFKGLASDRDGLAGVEVALVKGAKAPASLRFRRARLDDFAWNYALPTTEKLAPGTYTLVARATDVKGVRSADVAVTFRIR